MKKLFAYALVFIFVASIASVAFARTLEEEKAAVRSYLSVVDAKIVKYRNAGNTAKVTQLQAEKKGTLARWNKLQAEMGVAPAPVPPPPSAVRPAPAPTMVGGGMFGWGLKSILSGSYLYNGKGPISGAIGGRFDLVFDDPLALGSMVGLSANAVKYRVGLGGVYGKDNSDVKIYAVPFLADVMLMLPADMLGGIDSYVGGGLNYTLYGTGKTSGPYGIQAYVGIMGDLGLGLGKTALEIGYDVVRAGGSTDFKRSAKGITISVCQPIAL